MEDDELNLDELDTVYGGAPLSEEQAKALAKFTYPKDEKKEDELTEEQLDAYLGGAPVEAVEEQNQIHR